MKNWVNKAFESIEQGEVILYPTATVWGLGCSAFNCNAVEKIYTIKNRARTKPLIVLVKDIEQLQLYTGKLTKSVLELADSDEPISIIYPNVKNLPDCLLPEDKSLAIRVTKHLFCVELITKMNVPLVSTSANIAGQSTPTKFIQIENVIKERVNYVVPKNIEDTYSSRYEGKSSKLFRLNNDGVTLSLLRS